MSIALFIIILVVLILAHEFGHFLLAKRAGMKVEEFGIGFPPRLFSWGRGETTYSLNALPFGGFVRIFGEDPEEVAKRPGERSRSFVGKSRSAQAVVVVAGVAMNLLTAWILFGAGYMVGLPTEEGEQRFGVVQDVFATVTHIVPDSPALRAGLMGGDHIVSLNAGGETREGTRGAEELRAFIAAHPSDEHQIHIERQGEALTLSALPAFDAEENRALLGVGLADIGTLQLPPHTALIEGAFLTAQVTKDTAVGLWQFFSSIFKGEADFSAVAGPVGLVGIVEEASQFGIAALITLTALISINLAIINLLPFPALDGGRLVLIAIEAVRGISLPSSFISRYNMVGFLLLIGLMIAVTYNDIVRLLT